MRSVIRKPPTTLVVAAVTATMPRMELVKLRPSPAVISEATREMPEIAFVKAISGVCKSWGTLEMI
jgi:hypothetical protein